MIIIIAILIVVDMHLAAVGGSHGEYSRSPSFAEVQEMRNFTKRLAQQELEKLQQRFAPVLEAASVPFQVY